MSVWEVKARSLRRYLMSHVGVIRVELDGRTRHVALPKTPWDIKFTTARSHNGTMKLMSDLMTQPTGNICIFGYGADRTEDFIVTMTLRTAAPLLEAHYQREVLPRIQEGE